MWWTIIFFNYEHINFTYFKSIARHPHNYLIASHLLDCISLHIFTIICLLTDSLFTSRWKGNCIIIVKLYACLSALVEPVLRNVGGDYSKFGDNFWITFLNFNDFAKKNVWMQWGGLIDFVNFYTNLLQQSHQFWIYWLCLWILSFSCCIFVVAQWCALL